MEGVLMEGVSLYGSLPCATAPASRLTRIASLVRQKAHHILLCHPSTTPLPLFRGIIMIVKDNWLRVGQRERTVACGLGAERIRSALLSCSSCHLLPTLPHVLAEDLDPYVDPWYRNDAALCG